MKNFWILFLLFIAGYATAFFLNFTYSFQDTVLTYQLFIALYYFTGCCFMRLNSKKTFWFILPLVIHFGVVIPLTIFYWEEYLMIAIGLFSFVLGWLTRKQFASRRFLALGIFACTAVIAIFLTEGFLRSYLFNQTLEAKSDKRFPPVKFLSVEGDTLTNTNLEGKILVIETWYTRCGWCKRQFPDMNDLTEAYRNNGEVMVLAVNTGDLDNLDTFKEFTSENQDVKFQFFYDVGAGLHGAFGLCGAPRTFIFDQNGMLVFEKRGFGKEDKRVLIGRMKEVIDDLLNS